MQTLVVQHEHSQSPSFFSTLSGRPSAGGRLYAYDVLSVLFVGCIFNFIGRQILKRTSRSPTPGLSHRPCLRGVLPLRQPAAGAAGGSLGANEQPDCIQPMRRKQWPLP